jgi:Xaa-Pro dipeptidase
MLSDMSLTEDTAQSNRLAVRQRAIQDLLKSSQFNALILNPGPSLTYLTGLNFHLMERPVVAVLTPDQPIYLVIPQLEAAKTAELPFPSRVFQYGEDPLTWQVVFNQAARAAEIEGMIGVEPTRLRFLELRLMEAAAPEGKFLSAETLLAEMRLRKDSDEIARMRKSVEIAQQGLENTLPMLRIGMTERQVAAELTQQMLRLGADTEMPFSPIVSTGPNSANPHASPTDRPLTAGDLLVIDWGAYYEGYVSDLTRTFAVGAVDPELAKIVEIVEQANAAGRAAARPGVKAGSVDSAAREVIEKAGYGPYFTHRTGHGIGMEGHEAPYIRSGSSLILERGMAFTIEPGIYLPERGGTRIEDNVVMTADGAECLSSLPRQLRHVATQA